MKLWDKGIALNKLIEDFTVGKDYILDRNLLYYDCKASIAHGRTLERAGIITEEEMDKLIEKLQEIQEKGLDIKKEDEDVHTAIENYLFKELGELGKKIHTGRSRNDQVMVDIQLWSRDEIINTSDLCAELCKTINEFSGNNPAVMPGYTHMQKAMPSSLQLLTGAYIESLLDDLKLLRIVYEINNSNPLGSAAGYGSNLGLDRDFTRSILKFEKNKNCIYVQNRPKLISTILFPLCSIMKTLDKISSDLLLFTMREFSFFSLPDEFCTGSSIMPQKKNYDVLELLRAKNSVVHSFMYGTDMIGSKLISGYNRDYQETKEPLMEAFHITSNSLKIMKLIFKSLKVDRIKMKNALTEEIFATDSAYELVKKGTPFRDAYNIVAQSLNNIQIPEDIIQGRDYLKFKDYTEEIERGNKFFVEQKKILSRDA